MCPTNLLSFPLRRHSNCVIASNCLLSSRCRLVSFALAPLPVALTPSCLTSTPGPADRVCGNTYNKPRNHRESKQEKTSSTGNIDEHRKAQIHERSPTMNVNKIVSMLLEIECLNIFE